MAGLVPAALFPTECFQQGSSPAWGRALFCPHPTPQLPAGSLPTLGLCSFTGVSPEGKTPMLISGNLTGEQTARPPLLLGLPGAAWSPCPHMIIERPCVSGVEHLPATEMLSELRMIRKRTRRQLRAKAHLPIPQLGCDRPPAPPATVPSYIHWLSHL